MNIIGIISDTHRILPDSALSIFKGEYDRQNVLESLDLRDDATELPVRKVDHIVHAGDIGDFDRPHQMILDRLSGIAPVHAVLGNCDTDGYFVDATEVTRDAIEFDVDGLAVAVAHEPELLNSHIRRTGHNPTLRIHGHTHRYNIQQDGDSVLVCPGSANRPRNEMGFRTVALAYAEGPKLLRAEIVHL